MSEKSVVLGVTGSIAAYKSAELVRLLTRAGISVHCVLTRAGREFISPLTLATLSGNPVITHLFRAAVGPTTGDPRGGSIEHIRASREADLIVVAPATANILGKVANGIADDALSALLLASSAPVLYAPAMNTKMWEHPAVRENRRLLESRGAHFVAPGSGELACGEVGAGRMAEPDEILAAVQGILAGPSGRGRLLVTAGGTEEPIDPVRCVSNRSSGRMGFAIAEEGRDLGYEVTVVHGATTVEPPSGVSLVPVQTAQEMASAVHHLHAEFEILVMAAAVADYRPARSHPAKVASGERVWKIELVPNPDILASLRGERERLVTVGFALEWGGTPGERLAAARRKLTAKGCDLIALNNPKDPSSAFGGATNHVILLGAGGGPEDLGVLPKREVARRILARAEEIRTRKSAVVPMPRRKR